MKPLGHCEDTSKSFIIEIRTAEEYTQLVHMDLRMSKPPTTGIHIKRFFMLWMICDDNQLSNLNVRPMLPPVGKADVPQWNETADKEFCLVEWGGCQVFW